MDPLSQGVLGAIASQNIAKKKQFGVATLLGIIAAMSPDLDVFVRSETDPLLFLEYHRQFTHSLIFIPIGGLICALLLHWIARRWALTFRQTVTYTTAGYATHALLDACTSYGTQLFWPFSDTRVAWSNISIVDPLFTLPLLFLILFAAIKKRPNVARVAAAWMLIYLSFGYIQKERAETAGWELANYRGHSPSRLEAKPGFANLLLWKVIYEADNQFYVDGIRTGLSTKVYPGDSIAKLDVKKDFPWLSSSSQQAQDIKRFKWFSDGFIAVHPENPDRVIDVRYSMLPNEIDALWMIVVNKDVSNTDHVGYVHDHNNPSGALARLWAMLKGVES
jgi:inner membrane protein